MFYVGMDISLARTAVCIMDAAGQVVREQSVASTPEAITAAISASGKEILITHHPQLISGITQTLWFQCVVVSKAGLSRRPQLPSKPPA